MRITPQPGRRRGSRTRLQVRAPEAIPLRTQSVRASRDRWTSTRNSCSQSTAQERQVPAAMHRNANTNPETARRGKGREAHLFRSLQQMSRGPPRLANDSGDPTHNPQRKPLCELWRCGLGGRPRLGSQSGNVKFLNLESREDERPHGLASTETQNHETHAQRLAINA